MKVVSKMFFSVGSLLTSMFLAVASILVFFAYFAGSLYVVYNYRGYGFALVTVISLIVYSYVDAMSKDK